MGNFPLAEFTQLSNAVEAFFNFFLVSSNPKIVKVVLKVFAMHNGVVKLCLLLLKYTLSN